MATGRKAKNIASSAFTAALTTRVTPIPKGVSAG
jgi:hypothetical protein